VHHSTWLTLCNQSSKQASSFFNKNLTNADNDNSMNMSTKMEMSQVNKPANNVQTMQYVKINIQTPVGGDTPTHTYYFELLPLLRASFCHVL